MAGKRPRIGDIYEIRTPSGLAYIQFTHNGRSMGELVRVLPGLHESRPKDFARLASQKELYFIFYTLRWALRAKRVEFLSRQPVPDWARPYPLMRLSWRTDVTGKTLSWKIAKGSTEWTIAEHERIPTTTELTPEQRALSPFELWSHDSMVKRLAQGWTPEREEELRLVSLTARAKQASSMPMKNANTGAIAHYLYFPTKERAQGAAGKLRERDFDIEVRRGADNKSWLVLARQLHTEKMGSTEELRNELESLAEEFNGEYDGWELAAC